jgi:transcription elongation factor Elf1
VKSDLQPLKTHRRQNVKKRELKNLRDGMSPEDRIGAWLSAALEDPMVCDEMKQDIKDWFDQTNDRIVRATDFACPRCGHCCKSDLARVGEVGVWGAVQCEPQEALEDGWCDWVCPKPRGYLMQCCDCGLIHEVDFRVVQYEPRPSEVYEVVDDPNLQAQMRLKRRDDISPKQPRQWQGLTDEEILTYRHMIDWTAEWSYIDFARAIEQALKEKNHG